MTADELRAKGLVKTARLLENIDSPQSIGSNSSIMAIHELLTALAAADERAEACLADVPGRWELAQKLAAAESELQLFHDFLGTPITGHFDAKCIEGRFKEMVGLEVECYSIANDDLKRRLAAAEQTIAGLRSHQAQVKRAEAAERRAEEAESEAAAQARLVGIGIEREAKLEAERDEARRWLAAGRDEWKLNVAALEEARQERDSFEAMFEECKARRMRDKEQTAPLKEKLAWAEQERDAVAKAVRELCDKFNCDDLDELEDFCAAARKSPTTQIDHEDGESDA